ncbi:MAG: TonB-dependent receptor [Bacteroidota bacterium]
MTALVLVLAPLLSSVSYAQQVDRGFSRTDTVNASAGLPGRVPPRVDTSNPDTLRQLEEVVVTAAPFELGSTRAPLSLSVRQRPNVERLTAPGTSLDDLGRGVPGVWISDRGNPSTGERLLVRGLGWRAAFGVRGSHVLLDGVPLTLADGQSQLNVVDPALIRRVEVLRGPASTFWGSGSGGVVALSTDTTTDDPAGDGPPGPWLQARITAGAFGLAKAEAAVRPSLQRGRLAIWGSAMTQEGYRTHAATDALRLGVSSQVPIGDSGSLGIVALGAYVPRAQSPGGLTAEQAEADPRQTRAASIEQDAGKSLTQTQLALTYRGPMGTTSQFSATAWGGARELDNPIVPRYIQLDRISGGLRMVAEGEQFGTLPFVWGLGVEAEAQRDDRLEISNDGGEPGLDVLTDQIETVASGAVFGRLRVSLGQHAGGTWFATGALRADLIAYRAEPTTSDTADDAERQRTDGAISPSFGLTWASPGGTTLYANAAGAFDAPTTTELGNRSDGRPGLNPSLSPERTWGGEFGARRAWSSGLGVVSLDAALFAARVTGLLLPREIDDVTFFENGGDARFAGVEIGVRGARVRMGPGVLDGAIAFTHVNAVFLDRVDDAIPEGTRIPGMPPALATWTLTWSAAATSVFRGRLAIGLSGEAASAYDATAGGSDRAEGYGVAHVRLALVDVALGRTVRATPFVSVRNVTNAQYAGSVVVNAFGGRFLEPAPERHLIAGISVALD